MSWNIYAKYVMKMLHTKWKINKLFKMRQFSQIFLGKGLFVLIKGDFFLTKGHLANLEGQVEIKSTPSEVIFDTIDSN